jgi:hypothetical protein
MSWGRSVVSASDDNNDSQLVRYWDSSARPPLPTKVAISQWKNSSYVRGNQTSSSKRRVDFREHLRNYIGDKDDWIHKTVGRIPDRISAGKGARSLKTTAIWTLMQHASGLTPEVLGMIPWNVGLELWNELQKQLVKAVKEIGI